jgi:RND family efflux transporter MFP subunit
MLETRPGRWRRQIGVILALSASLFAAGCGKDEQPVVASAPAPALASAPAEMRDVESTWTADAVVEAVRQSTVAAQIAGRVMEMRFDVGDAFRAGDVLVRIDERVAAQAVTASEAQVTEARATLANARQQLERSRQLLAQKFISPAANDRAEADYKAAEARVASLLASAGQAESQRGLASIVAAFNGVVSARHVQPGDMATPGLPLLTGFEPGGLRVVATLPQAQLGVVKAGAKARIEVPSLNRWIEATRVTLVPSADPGTHTATVRLDLPAGLRDISPGMFARVHFAAGSSSRLMVQQTAVLRRSEVTAVYVLDENGRPQLRQVRLGTATDERGIEVLAGLKAGERVALDPLRAGMLAVAK